MSIVVFSNDKCCIQTKTILKTIFEISFIQRYFTTIMLLDKTSIYS